MNWKRILLAGLVAGVIIDASEFLLNGVVLADEMEEVMASSGLQYATWAMPFYVIMALFYGLLLAWLYAAMRPRFGAGPKTALIAAVVVFITAYLLPTIGMLSMGVGAPGPYALALVWGLAEVIIAGMAAGYLYRET